MRQRQRAPVQVNQFVGGLNTEANPLSFPPTASIDEENLTINSNGSRTRRDGFDVEADFQVVSTGISAQTDLAMAKGQFRWANAGGTGNAEFMVVQLGNYLAIHDMNTLPLSSTPVHTKTFPASTYITDFGFAVVDGMLVVATGQKNFYIFKYEDGVISEETGTLLIRDLFGVQAVVDGDDLTTIEEIQTRPSSINNEHLYNLRNQTYGLPRTSHEDETVVDTVSKFYTENSKNVYPSNADNLLNFLFSDANVASDRTVERFQHKSNIKETPGTSPAPIGYFIIDATERGESRLEREAKLREDNSELTLTVTDLKQDKTPGGASVLAQYSGRVWYAGFSGDVVDGDSKSPRMSSYVLFSQVVTDASEIGLCYQKADPTSNVDTALVDTDGGFIKIDGAYNIKALVPVGKSLFVLAENGVWRIVGADEDTFTATGYSVSKVSEDGCISSRSVVVEGQNLVYWGSTSIFGLAPSELGDWSSTDITENSIQTIYEDISKEDKQSSVGYYDAEGNTFRWVWTENNSAVKELILNLKYSAFTKNSINLPESVWGVTSVTGVQRSSSDQLLTVTAEGVVVTAGGEDVTTISPQIRRGVTTAYYTVVKDFGIDITYTFGRYNNTDSPYDWEVYGDPLDSPAYIITGAITGGDGRLNKDVPYLTAYFNFNGYENSCTFNAQWNWSKSASSGKWTSPREIYRVNRAKSDGDVIVTRNRVRGSGRSVAFKFESTEGKPFQIYGWEFNLEATAEE